MKKVSLILSAALIMFSCAGGNKKSDESKAADAENTEAATPEYRVMELPTVDLTGFTKDADGWISIFDGKTFNGWRGYAKEDVPGKWVIEDGSIKFNGSGGGEAQDGDGGDIIFAHKFKNFELEMEWKVAKGSNSGIFILGQEIEAKSPEGEWRAEPIYISAPECQVLDNAHHPDAGFGKDGNRQSSSLYDMIPAKPQNSKPFGEWNKVKIVSFKGTIVHYQNDEVVVEYHLWTQQWKDLLDASKFSKDKWPLAYELLMNCGGPNREGFIGLQDHGDDVWFKNIKVKVLD